jgi:hypothetical protein
MSIDENKLENEELVVDDISGNAEELENNDHYRVEDIDEAKVKEKDDDDDEEEVEKSDDEEDDEDEEPEVKEIVVPKTKAGVIQAAVDMLKAARKEDAQKIFAKMAKVDESEDDRSVDTSIKSGPQKKADLKAKAKVEAVDFEEDLDAVIAEEATLSDGFRGKAGAIFEAVLTSKLAHEVERLETEYAQNLEEEISDVKGDLVEKGDSYWSYVGTNRMIQNKVVVTEGVRTELAEEFMISLQ